MLRCSVRDCGIPHSAQTECMSSSDDVSSKNTSPAQYPHFISSLLGRAPRGGTGRLLRVTVLQAQREGLQTEIRPAAGADTRHAGGRLPPRDDGLLPSIHLLWLACALLGR